APGTRDHREGIADESVRTVLETRSHQNTRGTAARTAPVRSGGTRFPRRSSTCAAGWCERLGAAFRAEARTDVETARRPYRGALRSGAHLHQLHRRLRHRRPQRCQGAARGTSECVAYTIFHCARGFVCDPWRKTELL